MLQANQDADMSLRTTLALAAVIMTTAVTASAAAKKQRVPRSGPQAQAVAPRSAAPFNPYNPALTGAGSAGSAFHGVKHVALTRARSSPPARPD
jgi:hypothetical protein